MRSPRISLLPVDGPSRTDADDTATDATTLAAVWSAVFSAVMAETRTHRAALHRSTGSDRCDLQLSAASPGGGVVRIDGDCACRDFLVDMLVEAHLLLARNLRQLRNPPGAVRTHLRTRATHDWIRRRRIQIGAQARCDRIRRGARARGLPDEFHRALLEYLCDEAGSPAPLEDQESLVRRLSVRCAAEFGGEAPDYRDRVLAGLLVVERQCRTGPRVNDATDDRTEFVTWWERYIERPLGRRPPRSVAALPDDLLTVVALDPAAEGRREIAESDDLIVGHLVAAARRHLDAPASALREGLADLVSRGLVADRVAHSVLGDGQRMAVAIRELSALA